MAFYRRRAAVIEGVRATDVPTVRAFLKASEVALTAFRDGNVLIIRTDDRDIEVSPGDWVFRINDGRIQACSNAMFRVFFELPDGTPIP